MAVEAMYGGGTDSQRPACVVVDEMPATYLTNNMKDRELMCAPLYYTESQATEEEYAICVTPGNTELLNAINEVLEEMLKTVKLTSLFPNISAWASKIHFKMCGRQGAMPCLL